MTTSLPKILSILFLTVGLFLMTTPTVGLFLMTTPSASASAGSEIGHHVQSCAQVMGFDGTHNPGMHSGYAGWDPTNVC